MTIMMSLQLLRFYFHYGIRWIKYFWRAQTRYDVHSPFLSRFVEEVIQDRRWFYTFSIVEPLRQQLLHNRNLIERRDLGAGSIANPGTKRTIRSIAKSSALSPAEGRLLFRIVNFFKPKTILELGTSLGISTLYQIGAAPRAKMVTVEGCPATAKVADANFRQLGTAKLSLLVGPFREMLPTALQNLQTLDFLYLDGDHREAPTLEYIYQCLPNVHENTVFVIADIHWSAEMETAWNTLKERPEVTLSIDLFSFGLLFFRTNAFQKEHLTLIPYLFKPWRMGFWS